jgi:hypothetical protein
MIPVENETKAVVPEAQSIPAEVKAEVTKVASKVKSEVVKVAEDVKSEVVKVAGNVKSGVARIEQDITAEEKLSIRDVENEYLKAQIQIQSLSQATQNAQRKFTSIVEALGKKYLINPAELAFDNVELKFKAVAKAL